MTLCAAWIRNGQGDEGEELVFATDSRLGGGEAWDSGIKLFDLGRPDCLLCFTGVTTRAYPLILQSGNLKRLNVGWSDPRLDLYDVLESICNLFTDVCARVEGVPKGAPFLTDDDYVDFLFGGWSWRRQHFGIWKIFYEPALAAFIHQKIEKPGRTYAFLGDNIAEAEELLKDDIKNSPNLITGLLDMEPFHVLSIMARDRKRYPTIGGALQVAKVYRSGNSEFFGVMHPSAMKGKPHFLGREVNTYDAPPMRLLDPDTTGFIENLPSTFDDLEDYDFGDEMKFVRDCYPERKLKPTLGESQRKRLRRIFRDRAYRDFVAQREQAEGDAIADDDAGQIFQDGADESQTDEAGASVAVVEEGASNE